MNCGAKRLVQSRKRTPPKSNSLADAGTSVDNGHEVQESQHGQLSETSVGLERVDLDTSTFPFPFFLIRLIRPFCVFIPFNTIAYCHGFSVFSRLYRLQPKWLTRPSTIHPSIHELWSRRHSFPSYIWRLICMVLGIYPFLDLISCLSLIFRIIYARIDGLHIYTQSTRVWISSHFCMVFTMEDWMGLGWYSAALEYSFFILIHHPFKIDHYRVPRHIYGLALCIIGLFHLKYFNIQISSLSSVSWLHRFLGPIRWLLIRSIIVYLGVGDSFSV